MATLERLARDYATAHPKRVDDVTGEVTTWNFWCASLIFRFTGSTRSYLNATFAGDAATFVSGDPAASTVGAVHYWGSTGNKGHVAIDVQGGGRLLFMASAKVTEDLGTAIGFVPFSGYTTSLTYRGWGTTYGSNRSMSADDFGLSAAGAGPEGDDDMIMRELIQGPDNTVWYCYERVLRFAIPNERNLATYQAHLRSLGNSDVIVPKSAADLTAYGSPVYGDPLRMFARKIDGVIENEEILAGLGGIAAGVDAKAAQLSSIAEALAANTAAIKALAAAVEGEAEG